MRVTASAARPLWLPGTEAPAHLTGALVGDFGFDPLKLGACAAGAGRRAQQRVRGGRGSTPARANALGGVAAGSSL
jgi:hypothetical protein